MGATVISCPVTQLIIFFFLGCRCHLVDVMVEMDRILRPEGTAVIRDSPEIIDKVQRIATAIRWELEVHESEPESQLEEKILVATKKFWKLPSAAN